MKPKTSQFSSFFLSVFGLVLFVQGCANTSTPVASESVQVSSQNTTEVTPEGEGRQEVSAAEIKTSETKADPAPKIDRAKAEKLTGKAKFIAGIEVEKEGAIAELQKSNVWLNYSQTLDNSWSALEAQQLSKVRRWSDEQLQSIQANAPTIFYPFSGPDFLYAYSLFPQGSNYIMVGLEPLGSLPDFENMSEGAKAQKLQEIQQSLYAILQFSFFRTKAMAKDLQEKGVIPILLFFMARTNNEVVDIQYVGIDESGEARSLDDIGDNTNAIPGVKIAFIPEGETEPRSLYYFSTDLSNSGLANTPQFEKFVKQFDNPITYLKAASYLMYNESFSQIRDLIFAQSSHILQDDSGIPLRSFDREQWELDFYGTYIAPIDLFKNRYQPELRQIYQSDSSIEPLDFGIGYKYYQDSNLMLATRKN